MAFSFDKKEIRDTLSLDDIYQLLLDLGGDPEYTNGGIVSSTICHNLPGEGSHKLYYYENSGLFHCYTGCEEPSFDVFQLIIKINLIQKGKIIDLNDAVRYIAFRFGILIEADTDYDEYGDIQDWKILNNYDRIQEIEIKDTKILTLKEYDKTILSRMRYDLKLTPWLKDHISQETLDKAQIGYYLGGDQITIPHFDIDDRLVGLRGRCMSKEEAERYGKYRPLMVRKDIYNHPLGMNLYGLNWSKDNIKAFQKAIVFESEKSVLQYASYFGFENNISVACCGSSLSAQHMNLLLETGAKEIIIAFDRQFQELNDEEHKRLVKKLKSINDKYRSIATISFIFDKNKITNYKDSPTDQGAEIFMKLFKERIIL